MDPRLRVALGLLLLAPHVVIVAACVRWLWRIAL